jgi:hypothetical protein
MNVPNSLPPEVPEYIRIRPIHVFLAGSVILTSIMLTVALSFLETRRLGKPITAESFSGLEMIQLDAHSAYVSNINVDLQFPENYELQLSAPSQIELYGEKQGLLGTYALTVEQTQIPLNRVLLPLNVYLKLKLFYCRKSEQSLCLIKSVVFHVPVIRSKNPGELNIRYRIPAAEDIAKFD